MIHTPPVTFFVVFLKIGAILKTKKVGDFMGTLLDNIGIVTAFMWALLTDCTTWLIGNILGQLWLGITVVIIILGVIISFISFLLHGHKGG